MSETKVTGRVLTVRPDSDGTRFAVTIGQPPDLYWFRCSMPPKLGQRVTVTGVAIDRKEVGAGATRGSVTTLIQTTVEADETELAERYVAPAWKQRASSAVRRKLFSYQADGAGWLCSKLASGVGCILGDDPGLGKTIQAVAALCAMRAFPAVIVCPASLKPHWAREFSWANDPPRVCIMEGQRGRHVDADVFILNYELLRYREEQLTYLKPRVYVFDEAQNVKHPKARGKHRAAVATRLVRQTGGAIELTGTPVMNRPTELWRLLHLAEPRAWPSFADFKGRYLSGRKGKEVGRNIRTSAGKVERLDELHAAVGPFMLRRLKGQVLTHLPPKSRRSALVRIPDAEMAHYRLAEADVVGWLRALGQERRANNAKKAESIVKLTMLRRIAALGKLRGPVVDYLRVWFDRHSREPLVIFGYHRDVMLGLWKICRELGLRTVGIGGSESHEKRQRSVDAFQAGNADVFLAPIATAGVGLNLQRASEALFIERIWTPSGMVQAEDRCWRLGQTRPVTITYLDAAGTVDEHIATVLSAKQRLINAVVDDYARGAESLETVDEVAKRMQRVRDHLAAVG